MRWIKANMSISNPKTSTVFRNVDEIVKWLENKRERVEIIDIKKSEEIDNQFAKELITIKYKTPCTEGELQFYGQSGKSYYQEWAERNWGKNEKVREDILEYFEDKGLSKDAIPASYNSLLDVYDSLKSKV